MEIPDLFEYQEDFINKEEFGMSPAEVYEALLDELDFYQGKRYMYDRELVMPRLSTMRILDPTAMIDWGEGPVKMQGYTPILHKLCEYVEKKRGILFNVVLCNYYKDGSHHIGYHTDKGLDLNVPDIASLSFGQERLFRLRKIGDTKSFDYEFYLKAGSLFYMQGELHEKYKHSIVKTSLKMLPRINLTFRYMTPHKKKKPTSP